MSSPITQRPVAPDDEPFLKRVFNATRQDELTQVPWSESEKLQFLEMQYRAQSEDYQRRFPNSDHSVLLVDAEQVGRVWIGRWPDEIRLLDIALLPEHRNHGIGSIVLRRLQDEAVEAGLPLRHSVFKTNTDALRFYERLGFEVVEDFAMYVLMEWTDR